MSDSLPAKKKRTRSKKDVEYAYEKTRKSLIARLINWGDQKTWDEFYRTYWKLIYSVAIKSGLRNEEAFDVVQETILSVAKQSKEQKFDPEAGSFKSWLMNMTRWRIGDQFRKRKKDTAMMGLPGDDDRRTDALDRMADPAGDVLDRLWDIEWKSHIAEIALERVKARVSPKQFQVYHCHVVRGWEPKKVSKDLGVSMAQVYLAKHRVGGQVKKELAQLEQQSH
ncbi:MAG: sigma-70 family RNA polymerase sigma factor [Verrucomicrobiota bacterium]